MRRRKAGVQLLLLAMRKQPRIASLRHGSDKKPDSINGFKRKSQPIS